MASIGNYQTQPVRFGPTFNAAGVQVGGSGGSALFVYAVFTTAGAVASYSGSQGVTVTKPSGTGLYRITVPGAKAVYLVGAQYHDADGGVDMDIRPKSKVASTGVIDVTVAREDATSHVFAAANAISGDAADFTIFAEW